jgi:hypothetical protein
LQSLRGYPGVTGFLTPPCNACCSHDYFDEQQQSKNLRQGRYCARRRNETLLLNKKFSKYSRLTFQALTPMSAPVNFNGRKKTGKKNYWTLLNLAKCHALTFARRKENIKPIPVGPFLTCHHTNK